MNEIRFDNPPLLCVVFSLQFEPIQKLSSHLPKLIKVMEEAGLNQFEEVEMSSVHFALDPQSHSEPQVRWQNVDQWDFKNEEKTTLLRIDTEASSFRLHFSDYQHFEPKKESILQLFSAIAEAIPKIHLSEISLRYINHIPTAQSDNLLDWVHPALLGLPGQSSLNLERVGSNSETIFQSGSDSRLLVRCSTVGGGFVIPPDLMPLDLQLRYPARSESGFIRLENTHIKEYPSLFEPEATLEEFGGLRSAISSLFSALTTETAHKKWHKLSS